MVKRFFLLALVGIFATGCASKAEFNDAIASIEKVWKKQNAELARDIGSVAVDATSTESFDALLKTLERYNYKVKSKDRKTGQIHATGSAPSPLTEAEWEEVRAIDQPAMKKIVAGELPFSSLFFALHTDEVDLNLLANVKSLAKGSEVSLTYTMVDHKVLNMGLNAGESPPPAAARKALIKIWKEFEKQLSIIQEAKRS